MKQALIIDDNRLAADILGEMIQVLGLEVRAAYGPRPAIEYLKNHKPDIVFLDINMPGVSGFEVLAYLKREPTLLDIPVVIVTSDDQADTVRQAREEGALDLIVKPVDMDSIQNVLEKAKML